MALKIPYIPIRGPLKGHSQLLHIRQEGPVTSFTYQTFRKGYSIFLVLKGAGDGPSAFTIHDYGIAFLGFTSSILFMPPFLLLQSIAPLDLSLLSGQARGSFMRHRWVGFAIVCSRWDSAGQQQEKNITQSTGGSKERLV